MGSDRPGEAVTYEQVAALHDMIVTMFGSMRMPLGTCITFLAGLTEECLRQSDNPHESYSILLSTMQHIRLKPAFDARQYLKSLVEANTEALVDNAIKKIMERK